MASLFLPALTIGLSIWVLLISPAHSLTCTSQNFTNNRLYEKCADLPQLNSCLHYTYNSSNSSLSIAFISTPASSDGWIAWAINPTGTGMVGSQSLIAFKSSGSMVVKTYNISAYSSVVESKLSFDVWDLSAESGTNGTMIIYGSMKVPDAAEKLNQVWQVGAKVTDGKPNRHEFAPANLKAKGTLSLSETPQSLSPANAPSVSPTPGGPVPVSSAHSMVRTSKVGMFLGLILFFGKCFRIVI